MAYNSGDSKKSGMDLMSCVGFTDDKKKLPAQICLVGRSKSGRSTLASSFPEPRFWVNADRGLATPAIAANHDMVFNLEYANSVNKDPMGKTTEVLTQLWVELQKSEDTFLGKEMPKTIVVDTGSAISNFIERELVVWPANPKTPGKLQIGDYATIKMFLYNIIILFKQETEKRGINLIWIFNPTFVQDADMGGKFEAPDVSGEKFCGQIPHLFNEVYYMKAEDGKRILQTKPTKRFPYAGSKCGVPDEIQLREGESGYDKLKKYFGGE